MPACGSPTSPPNLFDTLHRQRAQEFDYPRHGFKETRCDVNTVCQLQTLFPDARFVFLVRDPLDVILSIKRRGRMGRLAGHATLKYYADHWRTRAMQFRQADFGLTMRYEDFIVERPGAGLSGHSKQTAGRFHPH